MSAEDFEVLRQHMLAEISAGTYVSGLIGKAALDERVMTAMGKVPRHEFVPIELQPYAYANIPLPIGPTTGQATEEYNCGEQRNQNAGN